MKKQILICKIFVCCCVLLSINFNLFADLPRWRFSKSTDEMTGENRFHAFLPFVSPTKKMSFPYQDIKATLAIGCGKAGMWTYIHFNEQPNFLDTETRDGYDIINTRIKWDDLKVETVKFTYKWGSNFINFENARRFEIISFIRKSNTLLLELHWYGNGKTYFKFPLSSSSKQPITQMRTLCDKL